MRIFQRRQITSVILLICFSLFSFSGTALAQDTVSRLHIELIDTGLFPQMESYLTISNDQGFPITGLTASDFEVLEDGIPVTKFDVSEISYSKQFLSFVLLIDTSGSMSGNPLINSIAAAKKFVEGLPVQDQIAVVSFSDEIMLQQQLTTEKALVNTALDNLQAVGGTSLYDGLSESLDILKDIVGRRIIIVISDGADTDSGFSMGDVIVKAADYSIPIYSIGFGNVDSKILDQISNQTGAYSQVHPDSSALSNSFSKIDNTLRTQYLLAYDSALSADDNEHALTVKLNRGSETIETQKNFIAAKNELNLKFAGFEEGQQVGGILTFSPILDRPDLIEKVELFIDDIPIDSAQSAPFEISWEANEIAEGDHIFKLIATDRAGNVGQAQLTLNVSRAIDIVIHQISSGDFVSAPGLINGEANAKFSLTKVELVVDDKVVDMTTQPDFAFDWPPADLEDGEYQVVVRAEDLSGYTKEETLDLKVRKPLIVTSPLPEALINSAVDFQADVLFYYGVDKVVISMDGEEKAVLTEPPFETSWAIYGSPGEHKISVIAYDLKGNSYQEDITIIKTGGGGSSPPGGTGGLGAILIGGAVIAAVAIFSIVIRSKKKIQKAAGLDITKAGLYELEGITPNSFWPLNKPEIYLGRKKELNDIPLAGLKASRQHALIRIVNGRHVISSLKSENPVLVNGASIGQKYVLNPGDVLQLGDTKLRYEAHNKGK